MPQLCHKKDKGRKVELGWSLVVIEGQHVLAVYQLLCQVSSPQGRWKGLPGSSYLPEETDSLPWLGNQIVLGEGS